MKKNYALFAALLTFALLLTACGGGAAPEEPAAPAEPAFKAAEITDMGGIDDKSFNASGWLGIQRAMDDFGIGGKYLESQQQSDYAKNIQQVLDEETNVIITVGFLLGVDTAKAAVDNPDQKFAIVDYGYPDCWPGAEVGKDCGSDVELSNVRGLGFQTDEASFLAGYLAAGMTETGKVATYGGIPLPTVTIFMRGYEAGVKHYNAVNGTSVEVLGWDSAADDGTFTGNFDSTDDGRALAESFVQEGADIILPVAGPVGLGSAAVCKESGACKIIGVDADWYETAPEFKEVYLTSVLKKIDVAVYNTIKDVMDGNFTGGNVVYTLADGGVDIAPFHDFDSAVSDEMKSALEQLKKDISAGTLTVDGVLAE